MRFYTRQHGFYCGIDLHARTMYVCVLDQAGNTLVHQEIPADAKAFLKIIAPYREDVVVCVECMFAWYWLADVCAEHAIPFVLGHALYMGAIHGGKSKNDEIDSAKIAQLLRGGNVPIAYAYPKGMRATRDLLRRRTYFVRQRAQTLAHIQNTNSQYNLQPFGKKLARAADREALVIAPRFADASVRKMVEIELALCDASQVRRVQVSQASDSGIAGTSAVQGATRLGTYDLARHPCARVPRPRGRDWTVHAAGTDF
jgi:transposase